MTFSNAQWAVLVRSLEPLI